jgi:DNA-binding NarL/FixJ family response regulator
MPESGQERSVSGRRKTAAASAAVTLKPAIPQTAPPKSAPLKTETDEPREVRIGLVSGEPIRLEGLRTIFDQSATAGHPPLTPIVGALEDLLANAAVEFLVVDMNAPSGGLEMLESVRRARPGMRQIVIGPESDEELVMDSIVAGARAYLDSSASPQTVRHAIEVVVSGSIWAPRRLLSQLIDRLLETPRKMVQTASMRLTDREQQVLELILLARSNREIARQLGIEERTVKAHVGRLMKKTGSENRIELSMRALNQSLVPGRNGEGS